MRLPRLRFTVRLLMVAVAVAAISFGVLAMRRRRAHFAARAARYASIARLRDKWSAEADARERRIDGYRSETARLLGEPDSGPSPAVLEWRVKNREVRERQAAYLSAMRAKYERAARYPWLPVEPDPPMPK